MLGQHGTTAGAILRIFVVAGLALGAVFLAAFFLCDGRVDRSAYGDRLKLVDDLKTVGEADRLLLPYCRKEVVRPGEVRYYGRPLGSGACFCAPVTVEVVVLHTDSDGSVVSTEIKQGIGFAARKGG